MRVIFQADDFGLTSGINRGIIQSFKEGLLCSTSLVASGEAAEEAVSLAKENPGLDVGIHLVLCDEKPALPPRELTSLISEGPSFPARRRVLEKILIRKIDYRQVEAEWRAQVEKVLDKGILISHMDSHQFVHLFPGLFPLCLRVAREYKIPYIRSSILDPLSLEVGFKRLFQGISLKFWISFFISRQLPSHIRTLPSIGFLKAGGRMNGDTILRTIERVKRKRWLSVVEVMLHPGNGDAYTSYKYRHWNYNWKKDLDLLLDRSFAEELTRRAVIPTSFREQLDDQGEARQEGESILRA